ncbi:hypothetical protein EXIGLDRAFT_783786 [Exidia glandulosa HHB12029]|uniref:Uncharacterized protein n=1 Tax=Exidia glandulosa HHB12029 TaxID=1314781 RepID=A0A166MW39_EXIGL|nr:hypothetical protein EXIGLDRAFT_783786 [Exidia glandulosa HHB12029]
MTRTKLRRVGGPTLIASRLEQWPRSAVGDDNERYSRAKTSRSRSRAPRVLGVSTGSVTLVHIGMSLARHCAKMRALALAISAASSRGVHVVTASCECPPLPPATPSSF